MAGAGVRVFLPGEVLTATLVNTYLQDQVVARFASAAARDAAFGGSGEPTLEEGRVCYLDSTNSLQYYSGSAWVSISSEAVTGEIQAKGDLVVGTGLNTISRVAVGTNDTILVADSTTASGVAWKAITVPNESITSAKIDEQASSYTLALTDKNKFIKMTSGSPNTVTVPTNASVTFPVGSQIHIIQYGAGKTQILPVAGTPTIYGTPGQFLRAQYSSATLLKCDTNIWMLMGDLSAS